MQNKGVYDVLCKHSFTFAGIKPLNLCKKLKLKKVRRKWVHWEII